MEFTMQNNQYFPITLFIVAMVSGCTTLPNQSLTDAHASYNNARTNPEVTNLAAVELKDASDSLDKADNAFNEDESKEDVNHLAYLAKQQVVIAQETAKRKTAEIAVTNAGVKRDQIRLEARTAEADSAKQQVAVLQNNAQMQANELAIAGANSERDKALIAQQEIMLNELNAKKTERGMVITLSDVLFRTNRAQLESGGIRNVEKLGNFLTQYPQYKVLIEGYTDSRGSNDLNQELSDRRAYSVRTALMDMQISNDRVSTRGYGEAFPIASNNSAAGQQLNRRVEIVLSDSNGNVIAR